MPDVLRDRTGDVGSADPAAGGRILEDALAVWHMADLHDSSIHNSELEVAGKLEIGRERTGAER